jgi:hypothetical protein
VKLERKRIAVFPESNWHARARLLDSLAELYPVDFVPETAGSFDRVDAVVLFSQEEMWAEQAFECGVSSFVFGRSSAMIGLHANARVSFSNHAIIHPAFRNARVRLGRATEAAQLNAVDGDTTLASHDSLRLWLVRSNGKAVLHTVAVGPPEPRGDELLWLYLQPQNWLALLPLLHFIRQVTAGIDWSPVRQHACFIFDDPNLHSRRYGYLDFVGLAREANTHNYHAAFATVPLDASYAAPKAVELFHKCSDRLSLLIHGNDHVRNELARDYTEGEALRILSQALTRIASLERRTGLKVSRVVAAPHGGFSESMMAQMLRLPLEGACASAGSIELCNPRKNWPLGFGLSPVCFMAGGFPVIRRFHLQYGLLPLRFAAFLGQPILPYGHHQDCAEGLGQLAEIADTVNAWANTSWTDLESILLDRCRTNREGDLLHVQLGAGRARVTVPEGIFQVAVHAYGATGADCRLTVASAKAQLQTWALDVPHRVAPSTVLMLRISSCRPVDPTIVKPPGYRVWPPVRRALAIGRDRLLPIVRSFRPSNGVEFRAQRG